MLAVFLAFLLMNLVLISSASLQYFDRTNRVLGLSAVFKTGTQNLRQNDAAGVVHFL
jgi:hypothetical protein